MAVKMTLPMSKNAFFKGDKKLSVDLALSVSCFWNNAFKPNTNLMMMMIFACIVSLHIVAQYVCYSGSVNIVDSTEYPNLNLEQNLSLEKDSYLFKNILIYRFV